MSVLARPGMRLHIDDGGLGGEPAHTRPVLLVHGWLGSSASWSAQLPWLRARRRAVTVDLPGHGASEAPAGGYAAADFAADLAAVIENLGVAPALVFGHSMGATVASILAADRPDLLTALVLVDPDYAGDESGRALLEPIAALAGDDAVKAGVAVLFADRIDAWTSSAELRARHRDEAAAVPAAVVAATLRAILADPRSIRFRAAAGTLLARRLQPVLSFHRDPERALLERRLAVNPASRAIAVPGAGHWLHQERPDLIEAQTERWLDGLGLETGANPHSPSSVTGGLT
jgi:pimeloyl-ACP methyl ester carboxylesterase